MRSLIRGSYANLVSTVALVLVLTGGVVYAGSLIRSGDIASNAVRSRHVGPNALRSGDIATHGVRPIDLATGSYVVKRIRSGALVAPVAMALPDSSWTQAAGEANSFQVRFTATLGDPNPSAVDSCSLSASLFLDSAPPAGSLIEVFTPLTFNPNATQTKVTQPQEIVFEAGARTAHRLYAVVNEGMFASCTPETRIESIDVNVIATR
jgi:hypothetical protein